MITFDPKFNRMREFFTDDMMKLAAISQNMANEWNDIRSMPNYRILKFQSCDARTKFKEGDEIFTTNIDEILEFPLKLTIHTSLKKMEN